MWYWLALADRLKFALSQLIQKQHFFSKLHFPVKIHHSKSLILQHCERRNTKKFEFSRQKLCLWSLKCQLFVYNLNVFLPFLARKFKVFDRFARKLKWDILVDYFLTLSSMFEEEWRFPELNYKLWYLPKTSRNPWRTLMFIQQ